MNAKKPTSPLPWLLDSLDYPIQSGVSKENNGTRKISRNQKEGKDSPKVEVLFVLFSLLLICSLVLWLFILPVTGLLYFTGILK